METQDRRAHKLNCHYCRSRKVKCDRRLPCCTNCAKKSLHCTYPKTFRRIPLEKRQGVSESSITRDGVSNSSDDQKTNEKFFYGLNSSRMLVRSIKGTRIDYDEPSSSVRVYELPRLVEDEFINISLMLSMVNNLTQSYLGIFYSEFIDFQQLCQKIESSKGGFDDSILLLYSILITSSRFVSTIGNNKLEKLDSEYLNLRKAMPLSLTKLKSSILYIEHLYYNFKTDEAFELLFTAVSGAYTLGIHVRNSKCWRALVFYDLIICSTLGRPTSVLKSFFKANKDVDEPDSNKFNEAIELMKLANNLSINDNDNLDYVGLVNTDSKFDELIIEIKNNKGNRKWEGVMQTLLVLLCCNQIKIQYQLILTKRHPETKIRELFVSYFSFFVNFLKKFVDDVDNGFKGYCSNFFQVNLKAHSPSLSCFNNQILIVLLAFLSSGRESFPEVWPFLKDIKDIAGKNSHLIAFDMKMFDYLLAAEDLSRKEGTESSILRFVTGDNFIALDLNDPFIFSSVDFLTLIQEPNLDSGDNIKVNT